MARVFLIVLDSFGVGQLPDAAAYGDEGSNTLAACAATGQLHVPNLRRLGLYNIPGVNLTPKEAAPAGCFGRLAEASAGKDTTTGHWEIAGHISPTPMPTYPQGFPQALLANFSYRTGRGVLCNRPYSGTQVIMDYGPQHLKTGDLIVYTSADSVFQIAAHESLVPPEQLYQYCRIARELCTGEYSVGRVIARPFTGEYPNFTRTANRRDFSLEPPANTLLDVLSSQGQQTIAVGKIRDIFAGRGIGRWVESHSNQEGMEKTIALAKEEPFHGLCFVNLVDFDMQYGHRNDAPGYAQALNRFDGQLAQLQAVLRPGDVVILTADHGCDPSTPSTDHSREYVPLLIFGPAVKQGVALGTGNSFGNIAATVAELLGAPPFSQFHSYWQDIQQG